ncbi:hypothetical protein D3C71_1409270 [compost metagenome]
MLPNISPTSGMNTLSLYLIFSRIRMNRKVPSSEKTNATSSFCIAPAPLKNMRATIMPNLAESIVPAVVGETNLFRDSCCMISPAMLMLMPATMRAMSRGTRLTSST